eukprot:Skav222010  [mRNA]  locus=scaffold2020:291994:292597:- [translate_table: standard]
MASLERWQFEVTAMAAMEDLKTVVVQLVQTAIFTCIGSEQAMPVIPPPNPLMGRMLERRASLFGKCRIMGYFGMANAPAKAFSQFCRLLLPAKLFSAAEEEPPQVLVKA